MPEAKPASAGVSPRDTSRVLFIDIARALGVLGVVVGHAWYGSALERILLSFDLALFFFVAGYVYSERYSRRPDQLVVQRLKTLYFPFIRWGLFWLALHNVLFHAGIYSARAGYLDQVSSRYSGQDFLGAALRIVTFRGTELMAGALWFLASLFLTNIFFGATSYLVLKVRPQGWELLRGLTVLVLTAAGYASNPFLHNRVYLGTSLVALSIFYAGLLYRRYESAVPMRWYYAAAAALVVVWGNGGVYFGANQYREPWLLCTTVPAGIYGSIYLAKRLEHNAFLRYVGQNTIFIIAVHFLAFKLVDYIQIQVMGYPDYFLAKWPVISGDDGWWLAYFSAGLFLPMLLKWLLDHVLPDKIGWGAVVGLFTRRRDQKRSL